MKKILYSCYTKIIAILLFILCICIGVFFCGSCIANLKEEDSIVYDFDNSFSESRYIADILSTFEWAVSNCYTDYYGNENENKQGFEEYITSNLDDYLYRLYPIYRLCPIDKIDYFISVDGAVISNCGVQSADELINTGDYPGCFYRYNERDAYGNLNYEAQPNISSYYYHLDDFESDADIIICEKIRDDYVQECENLWTRQAAVVREDTGIILFYLVAAIILLFYLIATTGKTEDNKPLFYGMDKLWTEIHLAMICLFSVVTVAGVLTLIDGFLNTEIPLYLMQILNVGIAALGSLLILIPLLSVVRKIKCHAFLKTSLIFKLFCKAWKLLKQCKDIIKQALGKKSGRYLLAALLLYTFLLIVFFIMAIDIGFFGIFLCILLFGFACYALAHRAKDLDAVKNGARAIRNGDLQYKIPELRSDDLNPLAQDINDIADGLECSMEERLKAERLKTDLITNVSHDLKTPLTSIINYATLLREIEGLPEDARDYIAIIEKKSNNLKNLTQDLFVISKVQSGNETFREEKLNAAQLIEQAMGEHHSEIESTSLVFCVNTEKDLFFMADGHKMSRVMSNLIENALKYAMANTRVFLEAHECDGLIKIEIKNISAEPMNFDSEEITARFVRGDSSRTDGGNGLGLAIAKSYTEGCGGTFRITIDGDLFKATLQFPQIQSDF